MNKEQLLSWSAADYKALDLFCKKNGISGFQVGNVNPKIALAMLKKQVQESKENNTTEVFNSEKTLLFG